MIFKPFIRINGILLCFFILFLASSAFALFQDPLNKADIDVYIGDKKIQWDPPPLVNKENILYLPLQEFAPLLNAKLNYMRKDGIYELEFPNSHTANIIVPQSREFWIGTTIHYFPHENIEYQGCLYVPFEDFLTEMGIPYKKDQKKIMIIINNLKTTPINSIKESKQNEDIFFKTNEMIPSEMDMENRLPELENDREQYISLGSKTYSLDNRFIYIKSILYLDLTYILRSEKYGVELADDLINIHKNNHIALFSTKDDQIRISSQGIPKTIRSLGPMIKQNNRYYIPFLSFLSAFDFNYQWNPQNRVLTILNSIHQIQMQKNGAKVSLKIMASQPITEYTTQMMDWPKRLEIQIPTTCMYLNQPRYAIDHDVFTELITNKTNLSAQINLMFKDAVSYKAKSTPYGLELNFENTVYSITQSLLDENRIRVSVRTTLPYEMDEPKITKTLKLIFDLPQTVCELPPSIDAKGSIYTSIRTSQFQINPLISRIVFDLRSIFFTYVIKKISPTHFDIEFTSKIAPKISIKKDPSPKKTPVISEIKAAIPTTPPKSVPVIQKVTVIEKPKIIEKPIPKTTIVIDPGHGGNDPGAISDRGEKEKDYTLDISLKLKKLLENAGKKVILTRSSDETVSLPRRVEIANSSQADLFISIHLNAFSRPYANGIETYYHKPIDKALAVYLHKEMAKSFGLRNNGIKEARMYVNRYAEMPTALVEPLYISNPREYHLINDNSFREKIAETLYIGITKYLQK